MNVKIRYIILLIITNIMFSNEFIPVNNSSLNYTQIFFKWPQISNSENYVLDIVNQNSLEEIQIDCGSLNSIIITDFFEWQSEYEWSVCGYDNQLNSIECYSQNFFSINNLPLNYPDNVSVLFVDELQYNQGITLLDYESLNFSAAVDMHGNPVWFADRYNFFNSKILAAQFLPNGNILGFGAGRGYEFDINSNIIFQIPDTLDFGLHHDIHKTTYNTYFIIDAVLQTHPCPNCPSELPDPILWQGDRFIELNQMGEIIWEWNAFDYLDLDEYNPLWIENFINLETFDWTHANSVYFHEENNMIYVSLRNLSRIVAIDYPTKEIIWNLGNTEFMQTPSFEEDFGFSHQHSAQIANDNLIFFDNGRDNNPELSRCMEISFSEDLMPELIWEYVLDDTLMTLSRGECDRLSNNNTLITAGRTGNILEVNSDNEIVWHLNGDANNGQDLSIYRSERILNLYPAVFSFTLNDLNGSFSENNYYIDSEDSITGFIYNQGWQSQDYYYFLSDENNSELYNDSVNIAPNSIHQIVIPLDSIETIYNQKYKIEVFLNNTSSTKQELEFTIGEIIIGDINSDGTLNILDIIEIINLILNGEFSSNADVNNDEILNVLDIISLVNRILDNG